MSVRTGTAVSSGEHLLKQDLVDELVAFVVVDYDPDAATDFGRQPVVDVELLVCSGEHKGTYDATWRNWGNLARQMGEQGDGTIAARVTSGAGKVKDSTWFGLDFELSADELAEVRQAVMDIAVGEEKKAEKKKEPKAKAEKKPKAPKSKASVAAGNGGGAAVDIDDPPF
jgi:hypothetical protein